MLSDYAGYMIASEEVESGAGWDYTCLYSISREAKPTGQVCGQAIIDAYRQYHETKVGAAPEYTLSTLDLSLVDTVVARLEALVEAAGEVWQLYRFLISLQTVFSAPANKQSQ